MSARTNRIRRHIASLGSPDSAISERAERCLIRYYGYDAIVALGVLGVLGDDRAIDYLVELTTLNDPTRPGAQVLDKLGSKGVPRLVVLANPKLLDAVESLVQGLKRL